MKIFYLILMIMSPSGNITTVPLHVFPNQERCETSGKYFVENTPEPDSKQTHPYAYVCVPVEVDS